MSITNSFSVQYIDHMGTDLTVVNAARASFNKQKNEGVIDEKDFSLLRFLARGYIQAEWDGLISLLADTSDKALIESLIWQVKTKATHFAPFTHPQISLRIDAPLAMARQIWRSTIGVAGGDAGYPGWSECFDKDTEVLTLEGWKLWPNVSSSDLLATPTLQGKFTYEKPTRLISSPYSGELIRLFSRDLELCTTPNHEVPVSYELPSDWSWTEFKKYPVSEAIKLRHARLPKLPTQDIDEGSDEDYWFGKLYGVFLGDGCISKDTYRVYVHVKKQRKKIMLRELLCNVNGLDWVENPQEDGYSYFRFHVPSGADHLFTGTTSTKSMQFDYINTLKFYRGLFDGLIATDGHITDKNCTTFSTTSYNIYLGMQQLCTILGREVARTSIVPKGSWSTAYKMGIKLGRKKALRNHEYIPYEGLVYCAETSSGFLYVRKDGKACITGNSSRRYVEETPEFFEPEIWRGRAENIKQGSSQEVISLNTGLYKQLVELSGECYDFMIKQGIAPEQARFSLLNSATTSWTWTGSLAFFARLCWLRKEGHAQLESNQIAQQVEEIIQPLFPFSWAALHNYKG